MHLWQPGTGWVNIQHRILIISECPVYLLYASFLIVTIRLGLKLYEPAFVFISRR